MPPPQPEVGRVGGARTRTPPTMSWAPGARVVVIRLGATRARPAPPLPRRRGHGVSMSSTTQRTRLPAERSRSKSPRGGPHQHSQVACRGLLLRTQNRTRQPVSGSGTSARAPDHTSSVRWAGGDGDHGPPPSPPAPRSGVWRRAAPGLRAPPERRPPPSPTSASSRGAVARRWAPVAPGQAGMLRAPQAPRARRPRPAAPPCPGRGPPPRRRSARAGLGDAEADQRPT